VPGLGGAASSVQRPRQSGELSLGLADERGQIGDLGHQRGRIQHGRVEAGQLGQGRVPRRLLR
jgi:hypothetical protein